MSIYVLKFCAWNIHGYKSRQIGNKLHNDYFLKTIEDQDIVCLTETHIHDEILEHLCIPGYKRFAYKNRIKNEKSRTASGGIAIFIKENLHELLIHISRDDEDTIWVKIKKEATKGDCDIYLGATYISPTTTAAIDKLRESASNLSSKGGSTHKWGF